MSSSEYTAPVIVSDVAAAGWPSEDLFQATSTIFPRTASARWTRTSTSGSGYKAPFIVSDVLVTGWPSGDQPMTSLSMSVWLTPSTELVDVASKMVCIIKGNARRKKIERDVLRNSLNDVELETQSEISSVAATWQSQIRSRFSLLLPEKRGHHPKNEFCLVRPSVVEMAFHWQGITWTNVLFHQVCLLFILSYHTMCVFVCFIPIILGPSLHLFGTKEEGSHSIYVQVYYFSTKVPAPTFCGACQRAGECYQMMHSYV